MACNCKHMEREITEYKVQIEALRELFIQRMTVDSETQDRRRRDFNQAIFHYRSKEDVDAWNRMVYRHPKSGLLPKSYDESVQVWAEMNVNMVLECFDNAVKDWRRTFCDVKSCRRK